MLSDILTIVLSSTLISGIISSLVLWISDKKHTYIENITKERKEWRRDIRNISLNIVKAKKPKERLNAINELQTRINSNGICTKSVFDDYFIWKCIEKILSNKNENEVNKIGALISCMLKYDWERSKEEVHGNKQLKLLSISLMISFVLLSIIIAIYPNANNPDILNVYINYCIIYIFYSFVGMNILSLFSKWRNLKQLILNIVILLIIIIAYIVGIIVCVINPLNPYLCNLIYMLVICNPLISMIYFCVIRALKYRNNVGRLIWSVCEIEGKTEISKKYKYFIRRDKREKYKYE